MVYVLQNAQHYTNGTPTEWVKCTSGYQMCTGVKGQKFKNVPCIWSAQSLRVSNSMYRGSNCGDIRYATMHAILSTCGWGAPLRGGKSLPEWPPDLFECQIHGWLPRKNGWQPKEHEMELEDSIHPHPSPCLYQSTECDAKDCDEVLMPPDVGHSPPKLHNHRLWLTSL